MRSASFSKLMPPGSAEGWQNYFGGNWTISSKLAVYLITSKMAVATILEPGQHFSFNVRTIWHVDINLCLKFRQNRSIKS